MKKVMYSIDVIDIKQKVDSGRLRVKLNQMGDVLMEDTETGEAVKIWTLPQPLKGEVRTYWKDLYFVQ